MKKFLAVLSTVLSVSLVQAQNDIDALRFTQTSFYGDSRFMSMAGSFGALGANLSCMNFNPAGIAMYRNGEFIFTPGLKLENTSATHYGNNATDFATKLNISNIGFVSAWDSKNTYPPSSKQYANFNQRNAFGISYNRMADFNSNISIEGYPTNSSIMTDFVNTSNGFFPSQMNSIYEGLAYETFLINSNYYLSSSSNDSAHYKNALQYQPGGKDNIPMKQSKTIKTAGRMGELAFSFAHAFDDKFYLGATLGIPLVKYNRQASYSEFDYKNQAKYFRSLQYDENLVTSGSGFNLKLGGIYRVSQSVRVGAYIHTPTVISLTDNYQYSMSATFDTVPPSSASGALDYKAESTGYYKYKITTPARAGASVCYIYNKLLAFNADAEYVNYAGMKLKGTDGNSTGNVFNGVNLQIASKYSGTVNLRMGAELNVRPVIIRAGFASYGSPFGDILSGKFIRNSYSGGIGFRGPNNVYFDMGLIYTQWKETYYLYSPDVVDPTTITNTVIYFTATVGIKFN